MLGERIASQSEVIRAIVSGYGSCCGGPAPPKAQLSWDSPPGVKPRP